MTSPNVIFDNWHPIAALDDVPAGKPASTLLLDTRVTCERMADGSARVARVCLFSCGRPSVDHTGDVFVGVVGTDRVEFTVIGDAVNVAQRLEAMTRDARCLIMASETILADADTSSG